MKRRLLNLLTALSLLLCVALCVLWVRSWQGEPARFDISSEYESIGGETPPPRRVFSADELRLTRGRQYFVYSRLGRIHVGYVARWTGSGSVPISPVDAPAPYSDSWSFWYGRDESRAEVRQWIPQQRPLFRTYSPGSTTRTGKPWPTEEESGWAVFFPHWVPIAILLIPPAAWIALHARRARRRSRRLCPECGYDLRATPGRCPECGGVGGRAAG